MYCRAENSNILETLELKFEPAKCLRHIVSIQSKIRRI
jgi:hypothetical protein